MPEQETELKLLEKLKPPAAVKEPVSETPGEPAQLVGPEESVSHAKHDQPKPEPVAASDAPVSKAPVELAPPLSPEKHESLEHFVSGLEKDELGAVTVPSFEAPIGEHPAEPEPAATPEQLVSREPHTGRKQPVSRAEFDQLKAERDQLLDRLARLQAEFENARKRAEREKVANRDYAVGNVVEKFLPVMDHFEMALKAEGTAEQLRSGVELIVKQMEDVLRQLQVTAIPALGVEFDPHQHEALGTVERADLPDQHVAEEIRRGYKLRDRLLRPSLVRVASNPKQTSE